MPKLKEPYIREAIYEALQFTADGNGGCYWEKKRPREFRVDDLGTTIRHLAQILVTQMDSGVSPNQLPDTFEFATFEYVYEFRNFAVNGINCFIKFNLEHDPALMPVLHAVSFHP